MIQKKPDPMHRVLPVTAFCVPCLCFKTVCCRETFNSKRKTNEERLYFIIFQRFSDPFERNHYDQRFVTRVESNDTLKDYKEAIQKVKRSGSRKRHRVGIYGGTMRSTLA